jgi:hypothetical protein
MATMENMIRNINRQLEQHAHIFGTDSETYKELVLDIERAMGKANYKQRNGAVGYSRSIPMPYKYDDVLKASKYVKGKNTATAKWSRGYEEAKRQGIDEKDVARYIRLQDEVNKNHEAIYNYMKEEMGDAFYSSDYRKGFHSSFYPEGDESFKESTLKHLMRTSDYKKLEEVEKLIKRVKVKKDKMKDEIRDEAEKTRGGKVTKKEAEQLKNRGKRGRK